MDRSGTISKKELKAALLASGIQASSKEIDRLFDTWDKDSSGGIDYNELNRALKVTCFLLTVTHLVTHY